MRYKGRVLIVMTQQEARIDFFNRATAEKRKGNFKEAIRLQQQSIKAYPEAKDIAQNFYALGKIFYLMGNYQDATIAYTVCIRLSIINNPAMLDDYKAMSPDNPEPQTRLVSFLMHPARHIGHAVFDPKCNDIYGVEIKNYRDSLMGLDTPPRTKREDEYDDKIIDRMLPPAFEEIKDALTDMSDFRYKTLKVMNGLANAKF